jgi:hypothetical protein
MKDAIPMIYKRNCWNYRNNSLSLLLSKLKHIYLQAFSHKNCLLVNIKSENLLSND